MGIEIEGVKDEQKPEVSPFEKRIARMLQRERRPSKIELHLLFGPHGLAEQAEWMRDQFAKADVILLENASRTLDMEETFNKISRGEISAKLGKDIYTEPFIQGVIDMIAGTKKAIGFHDVKEAAAESREMLVAFNAYDSFPTQGLTDAPPFEEALRRYEKVMEDYARADRKREEQILATLERTAARAIGHISSLRMKPEINVALHIGPGHKNMALDIKERHPDTHVHTAPGYEVLLSWSQLHQALKTGSAYPIELLERGLFENIALDYLNGILTGPDLKEAAPLLYKIFASFSREEIRTFYDLVVHPYTASQSARSFVRDRATSVLEEVRAQRKS